MENTDIEYDHSDPGKCTLCGRQMIASVGQTEAEWSPAIVCGALHCSGCVHEIETGEPDPRNAHADVVQYADMSVEQQRIVLEGRKPGVVIPETVRTADDYVAWEKAQMNNK